MRDRREQPYNLELRSVRAKGVAMPAKSQAQQRFMAICEHNPAHAIGKCPNMTHKQLHDFAATPRKGLPVRVKKGKKGK